MTKPSNDQAVIRRLWKADGPAYRDHLLRLDLDTRRDRFASMMSDGAVADYARRAITAKGFIFGAFIDGELRGVAELRPGADGGEPQAEAAFSVEKPYRRQGIGTTLFERLSRTARNRGIRRVQVRCLPHNRAMQGLARKVGAEVRRNGYDAEGYLTLDLPTPFSFWRETLDEAIDFSVAAINSGSRVALGVPRLR
jgi:RimJ/RimL family protein N-acetyltransferase